MDFSINLKWFAAPVLAQRNLELQTISQSQSIFDDSADFSITTVQRKIGKFTLSASEIQSARTREELAAILERRLTTMEFSDAQPIVPEVQPDSPEPEADSGLTETPTDVIHEDGPVVETRVDEGSPEAPPEAQREEPVAGPDVSPVNE